MACTRFYKHRRGRGEGGQLGVYSRSRRPCGRINTFCSHLILKTRF